MLLLIDNFDSFVYNLARYLEEIGRETLVVRNNAIGIERIRELAPEAIVISPGPCDPPRAGISMEVVQELGAHIPILGVCLGHQAIGAALGASVVRGDAVHGRAGTVHHDGKGIFHGIPNPFRAARYHSLVVSPAGLPASLEVAAWLEDGTIMALRHREFPILGVQFHPESVLTQHGHRLLENFLEREAKGPRGPAGALAACPGRPDAP
jgi:anthranilate synthase/aminodeoxychorismate synthase-like glutamine amidotransferase